MMKRIWPSCRARAIDLPCEDVVVVSDVWDMESKLCARGFEPEADGFFVGPYGVFVLEE
jgi:hypothetical protein